MLIKQLKLRLIPLEISLELPENLLLDEEFVSLLGEYFTIYGYDRCVRNIFYALYSHYSGTMRIKFLAQAILGFIRVDAGKNWWEKHRHHVAENMKYTLIHYVRAQISNRKLQLLLDDGIKVIRTDKYGFHKPSKHQEYIDFDVLVDLYRDGKIIILSSLDKKD